jgi:hypothetical protein
MNVATFTDADRGRIVTEVLELGEALFDTALEAAARSPVMDDGESFPEKEIRTAVDEFFRALRVLLHPEGDA